MIQAQCLNFFKREDLALMKAYWIDCVFFYFQNRNDNEENSKKIENADLNSATNSKTRPQSRAEVIQELKSLGKLRTSNVLTEQEFQAQKKITFDKMKAQ